MAESLLHQAKRYEENPVANLLGALLAGEAYELLLGMSKTTALEALLIMHKLEVAAEVEIPRRCTCCRYQATANGCRRYVTKALQS